MTRIFLIITIFTSALLGQQRVPINTEGNSVNFRAEQNNIYSSENYKHANEFISNDSLASVWNNDFYPEFWEFLKSKSLLNGNKCRIWIELECAADGKVENLNYKIRNKGSKIVKNEFRAAVKEFFTGYKYPLELEGKYQLCGNVIIGKS